MTKVNDVTIVGGGLAGLTAAAYLAQNGRSVHLLEKAKAPGGRAMTQENGGYRFNLGPHALYANGTATQVLAELGGPVRGHPADFGNKAVADHAGKTHLLPQTLGAILRTTLLRPREKLELLRLLAGLMRTPPASVAGQSVSEWVAASTRLPLVRQMVLATCRVATYCNDPDELSAELLLSQIQLGLKEGVLYLDGGWQTLVDGLRDTAAAAGAVIEAGAAVTAVAADGGQPLSLQLSDGRLLQARSVILAVDPDTAARLLPHEPALRRAAQGTPVQAAVLDVALSDLPRPDHLFALGIDRPLYLSVHSAIADLAPRGGALIHVARYLPASPPSDSDADRQALEAMLDRIQPGWRDVLVHQRFLPKMIVAHRMVTASAGGYGGRTPVACARTPGIFLAGDWVGPEGWLAEASFASARAAARLAEQHVSVNSEDPSLLAVR